MLLFEDSRPSVGFPQLESLSWKEDPFGSQRECHRLLKQGTRFPQAFLEWFASLGDSDIDIVLERSIERGSHYKWFLGGRRNEYMVWLHQYKAPDAYRRATRFAAAIHNHRYCFSSRVVGGALHSCWYEKVPSHDGDSSELRETDRVTLKRDTVVTVYPDEIHQIQSVEKGTLTFLIQSRPLRHASTVFNVERGASQEVFDFDANLPRLMEVLSETCRDSSGN